MSIYSLVNHRGVYEKSYKKPECFSLTEALISTALLGAVFISAFMGFEKINEHQKLNAQLQSSELIKNSLYSILNNPFDWENTKNSPSNSIFNCIVTNSCKGKQGYINEVKTASNLTYFKDTGSHGFKAYGKSCVSSGENKDPGCFLTVKLKVSFICDGECKSPLANVEGMISSLGEKNKILVLALILNF